MGILEELAKADGFYYRNRAFRLLEGSNRKIQSPSNLILNIGDQGYCLDEAVTLDPNDSDDWDESGYTTGAARAGIDVSIFGVRTSKNYLKLLLSLAIGCPIGYDLEDVRLLGGFHCLPVDTALALDHPYYGKLQGDPLQNSIWDQWDRPRCDPRGMVKASLTPSDGYPAVWGDIYPASANNINALTSVYGAGILVARSWDWHVRNAFAQGKRLLTDQEFTQMARGSPEGTNIVDSTDPLLTSIPLDTGGVSILSDIGMAMMTGCKNQWIDATGQKQLAGTATAASTGSASATGGGGGSLAWSALNEGLSIHNGNTGNQVYLKFTAGGTPYLCANIAGDTILQTNNFSVGIVKDAAASDGLALYFDYDGDPAYLRLLIDGLYITGAKVFIPVSVGSSLGYLVLIDDLNASTKGVSLYYDDVGDTLYAEHGQGTPKQYLAGLSVSSTGADPVSVGVTVNTTVTPVAPAFSQLDIEGHGKIYQQVDIKQVAGGKHDDGVNAGTASRSHGNLRTARLSSIGARYCCGPALVRSLV